MPIGISEFSIYTIIHVDELNRIHEAGGAGTFTEKKGWKTGAQLFHQAQQDDRRMPVLFADAAATQGVIYYAFLTDVQVMGERNQGPTHYSFDSLKPVRPTIPNRRLTLKSNGQPLSDDFIRPYAIVHTPDFVKTTGSKRPESKRLATPEAPARPPRSKTNVSTPDGGKTPTSQPQEKEGLTTPKEPTSPTRAKAKPSSPPIYLFGYSGKTDQQIEQAIGDNGLLLDIRFSPKSRRAGYSRAGLIRTFGDRYRHVRELGNANYQGGPIQLADPDKGLKIFEELVAAHDGPIFLMCACEDGAYCHRRNVGELLKKRGYNVSEYNF